ncbi:MAG: S1 RNA-binding domain-containing protein [Chloroflexota bacterium]|nr:S1 RNA-binding domain-containing protein [Chloroflexota bacterium]
MNQEIHPWEKPLSDSYWQALLEEESTIAPSEFERKAEGNRDNSWPPAHVDRGLDSSSQGRQQACWAEVERYFERGEVIELEVVGYNRGGVLVNWESLQGFVPASQLVGFKHPSSKEDRIDQLRGFVGQKLELKIIELDMDQNRFILSQRAAKSGPGSPEAILDQLVAGDVCEGRVTNLRPFGAFVDLGGVEGLIHISELSWGRVDSPSEVLSPGDKVQVYVLSVDRERHRVGLSLKRLKPNPWDLVEENYQVGQLVEGMVTNVVDFGAFVRIEEGLEGLIHVSELAEGSFLHPRNVVQKGEKVTVRIINIDVDNHRLGLSLRQV